MMADPASFLELYLEPLAPFLARSDVSDIYVNRPGELWIETLGGATERYDAPALDTAALWRLAWQIASEANQGVSAQHPLLAATLPGGGRVQIVAAPATRHGLAVAIRQHRALTVDLDDYRQGALCARPAVAEPPEIGRLLSQQDYPAVLAWAVRARKNILISGGTSTGKTTLLNSLLRQIPNEQRLIFIEDTPELTLSHPNSVGLVAVRGNQGEARVTSEDLLQAALRMRPDRIILGELRGPEALTFLRAINTGHPGSMTTIHADSPERAFVQLAMMALQVGLGLAYAEVLALVGEMVDVVVQVERAQGGRRIAAVHVRS